MPHTKEELFYKADNLVRSACPILQSLFCARWKEATGWEWSEVRAQDFIRDLGSNLYRRAKPLQRKLLEGGNVEEWDVTLLAQALASLQQRQGKGGEGENDFQEQVKKENSAIQTVVQWRNKLAHKNDNKLDQDVYQHFLEEFRSALLCIGDTTEDQIDKLIENAGVTSSVSAWEVAKEIQWKADAEAEKGNLEKAVNLYSEALSVPSLLPVNQGTIYEKMAETYYQMVRSKDCWEETYCLRKQADESSQKAVECNKNSWRAYHIRGKILEDFEGTTGVHEAIRLFTKSLAISPGQSDVKSDLYACRLRAGEIDREDYRDPNLQPIELSDWVENFISKTGVHVSEEQYLKMYEIGALIIPGQTHVENGHRYKNGWKVRQCYMEAARFYTKATKMENAEGMFHLAVLYLGGKGVERDIPKALELLRRAAEKPPKLDIKSKNFSSTTQLTDTGVYSAQQCLGLLYQDGVGVEKDPVQAFNWYKKASENGSGNASLNLGLMYWHGEAVTRNAKMAEMYWRRSLELNNDSRAAKMLYVYYMKQMEPAAAKLMFDKAIDPDRGDEKLATRKDSVYQDIEELENRRRLLENGILEFEEAKKLKIKGLTFLERVQRKAEAVLPEAAHHLKTLYNLR